MNKGAEHPNWKGGKPRCQICNILLGNRKAVRCPAHRIWKLTEEGRKKRAELARIKFLGKKLSPSHVENLRKSHLGKPTWNTGKVGLQIPWNKGLKGFLAGEKSGTWKGGITSPNRKIRTSTEYKEWRRHVFQRDDYTCQACGQRGGKLNADHELPFAFYLDLRFEILNGRTLCVSCHHKTPTWGRGTDIFSSVYNFPSGDTPC